MKTKLLTVLIIVLVVLNGFLIYILVAQTHQRGKKPPARNFLTNQLNFSEEQKGVFTELDEKHRERMLDFERKITRQKDNLFSSFQEENSTIDTRAIIERTSRLEVEKELEVFEFFKQVRAICNEEQKSKFDKIIKQALRGNKPGPPNRNGDHFPRERRMPPPPR
ncbi:Spy/CpxP family protein refolding chaperone [Polaribacter dokdonensis]|uniref:Periplasmic heavy metal sensor n=1 Tax=Polaribacter dokdonensis DSW-5 TaxID=1300348 RepID=A0A0M9CHY6_9FLAO|nr:Spy/CpxP family protein refolding chaperone [Polaribacter dokdonensis]KOY52991.1 hypothetical protein I602_2551 [Polaribacter dokdonensis DSW-5]SEE55631.1 hypothetical protein SAMN05444353_2326 [Polaribacter dokdonensis DSW-5]